MMARLSRHHIKMTRRLYGRRFEEGLYETVGIVGTSRSTGGLSRRTSRMLDGVILSMIRLLPRTLPSTGNPKSIIHVKFTRQSRTPKRISRKTAFPSRTIHRRPLPTLYHNTSRSRHILLHHLRTFPHRLFHRKTFPNNPSRDRYTTSRTSPNRISHNITTHRHHLPQTSHPNTRQHQSRYL